MTSKTIENIQQLSKIFTHPWGDERKDKDESLYPKARIEHRQSIKKWLSVDCED